jgi:hypothetical protein
VLVIRDQELVNPDATPVQTDSMPAPQVLRDAEGDILNNGAGTGKPAKDLSINFVPGPLSTVSAGGHHDEAVGKTLFYTSLILP